MKRVSNIRPVGHVFVPVAVIGSLSIFLAAGLDLLGILGLLNAVVLAWVSEGRNLGFARALPEWSGWLAAAVCGFMLPYAMLRVAGVWRRCVLWISTLFLMVSWAPVLALSAYAPVIGAPLIVVLWAGICALIYANHHQMPCEHAEG